MKYYAKLILLFFIIFFNNNRVFSQVLKKEFEFNYKSQTYPFQRTEGKKVKGKIVILDNDSYIKVNINYFGKDSIQNEVIEFHKYLDIHNRQITKYSYSGNLNEEVLEILKIIFKYSKGKYEFSDNYSNKSDFKLKLIQRNISSISKKSISIVGKIEYFNNNLAKYILNYRELHFNGKIKLDSKKNLKKMKIEFRTGTPTSAYMMGTITTWKIKNKSTRNSQ